MDTWSAVVIPSSSSYSYIQGNTLSYACVNSSSINHERMQSDRPFGDHFLIEGNDLSHYTLGINFRRLTTASTATTLPRSIRNGGQRQLSHGCLFLSEPGSGVTYTVEYNVFEGNYQYNAVGPNAKAIPVSR